ncbi:transposase, IS605 OrfB family [Moraxella caviae]|uniref:Transposase, IS605 OrfB family n=1 Tax=Moraxella caviae TaxID=34060 RepID=A0A378R6B9_9GAMM|nr:RNA-guided endonuclease TnpB family protein [Moraxella caviae]STZ13535.1 transposase, IS605 OrfB family [Moraxella caviae]
MKTLKFRIYDKHKNQLENLASSVNFVWNYVNELGLKYLQRHQKFLSAYDLNEYTTGANTELGLHSQTVQAINETHVKSRKQFKKVKLNWRTNNPKAKRKSLGWIPFKKSAIKLLKTYQTNKSALKSKLQLSLAKGQKLIITVFDQYDLSKYAINTCEIVQDSRGHWYACVTVKDYPKQSCGTKSVGLDLGCKDSVTASDGNTLTTKFTHKYAQQLAKAQRANKKKQVKAIHAKIKNSRLNAIHQFTSKLVKDNALIVVGKLKSNSFTSTKLAKSVYDAGWFELKRQLEYKCKYAGCLYEEVSEKFTTQTCSHCLTVSDSSPKGRAGLGIRVWTCSACNTTHDRDVNAAKNILRIGRDTLAVGSPSL